MNGSGVQTESKKIPLLEQILRFGVVGFISFFVDFGVYTLLCNVLDVHYIIAGFFGFVISVIVNYYLSMHYVFESRDDISKRREFIVFVILSAIGLLVNELILFICVDGIYYHWSWLNGWLSIKLMNMGAKVAATGVVMVYNFVTRKIFLEKKN
ncbi:MAG: GtrA family protein [Lachnospiraceae bacterium]|nr:GtrA family protein [Lachnospiraceae bacterium]